MRSCDIVSYGDNCSLRQKQVYVRGKLEDRFIWLTLDGVWVSWLGSASNKECIFPSRYAAFHILKSSLKKSLDNPDEVQITFVNGEYW